MATFGKVLQEKGAQFVTCAAVVISAILSCFILKASIASDSVFAIQLFEWIDSGTFSASWGIYIDTLSALMIFVVASVSALVHIYSVGYMRGDPHVPRFMCYLSLFTFSMLMLVTSDNFIQFSFVFSNLCIVFIFRH